MPTASLGGSRPQGAVSHARHSNIVIGAITSFSLCRPRRGALPLLLRAAHALGDLALITSGSQRHEKQRPQPPAYHAKGHARPSDSIRSFTASGAPRACSATVGAAYDSSCCTRGNLGPCGRRSQSDDSTGTPSDGGSGPPFLNCTFSLGLGGPHSPMYPLPGKSHSRCGRPNDRQAVPRGRSNASPARAAPSQRFFFLTASFFCIIITRPGCTSLGENRKLREEVNILRQLAHLTLISACLLAGCSGERRFPSAPEPVGTPPQATQPISTLSQATASQVAQPGKQSGPGGGGRRGNSFAGLGLPHNSAIAGF